MTFKLAQYFTLNHNFNKETQLAHKDWLHSFLVRNPELSVEGLYTG